VLETSPVRVSCPKIQILSVQAGPKLSATSIKA
jgi:hypothetical protein